MTEIDPKLSRLYREASSEGPPAALDAAILAAGRKQVAKPQRRERSQRQERSFWSRWLAPAGAIATLALGVSIALLVEREQTGTSDDTAIRRSPPQPQSPPAASATESAKAKAADRAAPAAVERKETPAAAGPAPSAAQAFPAERRAKTATPSSAAPKAATESNVASDSDTGGLGTAAPAAPAAAGKLAPMRQQAIQRSPEAWLEQISRLKREGRDQEAAEQLAEFRKIYPAYAVPQSLIE